MNYFDSYRKLINKALHTVDEFSVNTVKEQLVWLANNRIPLLVCGNGGSAAITEHLSCDHTKGIACDTDLNPFVIPLQSNVSLNTAIANDFSYDEVFSKQVKWWPKEFGLLVVSSSGNSPNIINAVLEAKNKGAITMGMVGFDGGKVKDLLEYCIHVDSDNYGIIEDCHQIIMHSMAQSIRIKHQNHSNLKL